MVQQKENEGSTLLRILCSLLCGKTLVGWIEALPPSLLQQMDALLVFVH
jgi:hypothetical protein